MGELEGAMRCGAATVLLLLLAVAAPMQASRAARTAVDADFVAAPLSGPVPLTTIFTNTSGGAAAASLWSFGDGLTSTLANPTHTYAAAGTFTITLTVSDVEGSDTEEKPSYLRAWSVMGRAYLPLVLHRTTLMPGDDPPQVAGCDIFPKDSIWNSPVDALPVHANSAAYVSAIGISATVHADFGSGEWPPDSGSPIGIPFTDVPDTQALVSVSFGYDDESDPGPYPIPPDAPIEGGPSSDGDRHVLIVERDACVLYELFAAYPQPDGSWNAGSGAKFDLGSNMLRPDGWTSADAAGLPILPGLVRYDEVASGEIHHALRFTTPGTQDAHVWPARHEAGIAGAQYPPMGQRFRLKAGVDITGFSTETQVILQALKRYGMMLADNGSAWYLSGAPDERWDNDVLHELHQLTGSDFEAVDISSLMIDPNSGQATTP